MTEPDLNAVRQVLQVKRYDHLRLYWPAQGRYISVEELHQWKADGILFRVEDSDTGENVTDIAISGAARRERP